MDIRRMAIAVVVAVAALGTGAPSHAASNSGTEFWAVDLDNIESGTGGTFAIVVSNTGAVDANVTIETVAGQVASAVVASGGLKTFGLARNMVNGTVQRTGGVYRVRSDQAIVAYQFNPLENLFTNDASLLLPTATLGNDYFVMSRQHIASYGLRGSLSVVATEPDTEVTVQVTGQTLGGVGIPATPAGGTITRTLQQFEVLNIETDGASSDLTGSRVTASKKVAVFGGSECSFIPDGYFACDHLEEQMFPVTTLGKTFDFCRSQPRGSEPDYVRVLATEDQTTITTDPAIAGTPATLNAGQFVELNVPADVEIDGDKPLLIGQYLVSQQFGANTGDPSMILAVPSEQFRTDYIFLTPNTFAFDWVTVTAPTGATVTLDGTAIPSAAFTALGDSGFSCARVAVSDGAHRISGDQKFGIAVYGYDQYASYGYTGGLELAEINCREDGLRALDGTPADGAASQAIHDQAESAVEELAPGNGLGQLVHDVNCAAVVPVENAIEGDLPGVPPLPPVPPVPPLPVNPGLTPEVSFADGFEGGQGGWTIAGNIGWQVGTPTSGPTAAAEGANVAGTVLAGNYPDYAGGSLTSPVIDLTNYDPNEPLNRYSGQDASLAFKSWFSSEPYYDCGDISLSVNGGPFEKVAPREGYPYLFNTYWCGNTSFSGHDGGLYKTYSLDLTPYAGDQVAVRFTLTTDSSVTAPGWYVDDFTLSFA